MTVRSVLEIDVADESFQKFKESFGKYQQAVRDLPGQWNKIGTAAEGASNNFADMVAAMLAGNEQLLRINKQTTAFGQAIHGADGGLMKMVTHSHRIAANIGESTRHLMKWTGIFSPVGGLVGAGSLWGLDRLAGSAASGRRSSMGLGMSFGEQRAFGVDFSRLVDPDSFLASVNDTMTDISKRGAFAGLGINPAGKDTAEVGVEVLRGLKRASDTVNPAMYAQYIQGRQLGNVGASPELMNRLHAMSAAEFNQLIQSYGRDRLSMAASPDTLRKWADLSTQLSRAGTKIETVLINDLSRLAPPLSRLSEGFTSAIDAFLRAPVVGSAIDGLASGFGALAVELGSNGFNANVREFTKDIGLLANALGSAIPDVSNDFADIGRVFRIIGDLARGDWTSAWSDAGKLSDFRATSPASAPAAAAWAGGFAGWWGGRPDIAGGWGVYSPNSWFTPGVTNPLRARAGDYIAHGGEAGSVIDNAKKGYYVSPDTGMAIPVPQGGASDWGAVGRWWNTPSTIRGGGENNPGNLRVPGSTGTGKGAFQGFDTPEQGVTALDRQLLRYGDRHINTLRAIISKWSPPNENATAALIANAAARTKFGADQPLNLYDPATLTAVSEAIIRQEQGAKSKKYLDVAEAMKGHLAAMMPARDKRVAVHDPNRRQPPASSTRITISNNTGGSAIISTASLAGPT
jgi:hypothetical protein